MSYKPPRGRTSGVSPLASTMPSGPNLSYINAVAKHVSALSLTTATIPGDIESRIEVLLDKVAIDECSDERYKVVAYASALEKDMDGRLLGLVLDLIFKTLDKYNSKGTVAYSYASLCQLLVGEVPLSLRDGTTRESPGGQLLNGGKLVRKYLLDRCYREMDARWAAMEACLKTSAENPRDRRLADASTSATERWVKFAQIIGQLYSMRLADDRIIHQCISRLLATISPSRDEAEAIQSLMNIVITGPSANKARVQMDAHHLRLYEILNSDAVDSEVKLYLKKRISAWQLLDGGTLRFNQIAQTVGQPPSSSLPTDPSSVLNPLQAPLVDNKPASPVLPISVSSAVEEDSFTDERFEITPTTPINLVVAFFKKVTHLADYTSQLDQADCSSQPLAHGGSSEVYRATLRNDTRLAIKCMRPSHVTGDSKAIKRTARELDAWSQLRHENILELLGLALFKGRLAMVSTWMELGNVVMVVNNQPGMNRYKLCIQVVGAIVYLHGMEIVHGDLKGANVLVSHDGKPKLADFGLTITQESKLRLSETDPAGGTLRWMAPEMFGPDGRRSPEADVYALGMTMLEILTGKEPFSDVDNSWSIPKMVLLERQMPGRPENLSVRSPLNNGFWAAMQKCWMYEPGDRARAADVKEMIVTAGGPAGEGLET